jgi:hypothetical protein
MKKFWFICVLFAFILAVRAWDAIAAARGSRGGAVGPIVNGDTNGDGKRDITDPVYMLNWLFSGGPEPVACAAELDALCVDAEKNVGIGTCGPVGRLTVTSEGSGVSFLNSPLLFGLEAKRTPLVSVHNERVEQPCLTVSDRSDDRSQFVIDADGNVAIGREGPANAKLEIAELAIDEVPYGQASIQSAIQFFPQPAPGLAMAFIHNELNVRDCLRVSDESSDSSPFVIDHEGKVGVGTPDPRCALDVTGTVSTHVLEITGGADIAEPFEVTAPDGILPGMVVTIDPDRPGRLRLSKGGYNRMVAGVVSGANGINPGLTLRQAGTAADGSLPVSLSGRVYCWVDAAAGAVEPGDLLTTSDTPGHAMKVDDHARAQGAVLGKALTQLAEGKGLILVLVTLQ